MELVRALGILLERGWRPQRTITIASWDAEEYGTVGSTEWIEDHAAWLKEQAVAYINVDYAVSGSQFSAQASPLLKHLLYQVTDQVIDPQSSSSVYARWLVENDASVDALSIDSDHVGFFHQLGIASLSMGFRGDYPVHHSTFDSVAWMQQHVDPLFEYHQTLTKIWGMLLLRLASDPILPLHPQDYTSEILQEINRIGSQQGCLTFPYISSALHSLAATTIHFERTVKQKQRQIRVRKHNSGKLSKQVALMNDRLAKFEQAFVDENSKSFFKHLVYGPHHDTGMTVTFPTLKHAVEKDDMRHINWVEKRIGHVLIQADRTLRGNDDDDFDQDDE
jgi:N-acetylated-alpha-linked acidic dipeptidase